MDTILLPFRECLPLSQDEIGRALARSSPTSAPGPDMTPNSVWKRVHRVAPHLIRDLLAPLVTYGSHPLTLKRADGIVLDKHGKPSYDSPSSFCVIVLLETFSKILERIMNSRLSSVARATGLLNPHQCGSLAGLSASDAVTTLTHEVKTLQMAGRKVSTLFLDIKGGFDNVNPSSLCGILRAKGVNPYLVSWTRSFLSGRTCWLLYQGSPRVFAPVSVCTPQGSPVSPLLFVIYVSRLHCEIPRGLSLSYVDDFGLTVSSASYRHNIQTLQKQYAWLKTRGSRLGVGFSVPKTELIHWRTSRDRDPNSYAPVHLDGSVFTPKSEVRWLGYWLTPSISTTPHFVKRLAKAQAAFVAVKCLCPRGSASPLSSAIDWPPHSSSPSSAMARTSSGPPSTCSGSSPRSGTRCRDGLPTASCLPHRISWPAMPASHHSNFSSRTNGAWQTLGLCAPPRRSTPQRQDFHSACKLHPITATHQTTGPSAAATLGPDFPSPGVGKGPLRRPGRTSPSTPSHTP